MAIRLGLVFLVMALALAMVANSSPMIDTTLGFATRYLRGSSSDNGGGILRTCNGKIGDCIDADEEGMMESESSRRTLAGRAGYISYGAMKKNSIPCNKRGASYYGCTGHSKANPYTRGCSNISKCARNGR